MKKESVLIGKNSRVLVTGGYGFVGQYLVKKLLQMGASVSVIDDLSTSVVTNLPEHSRLKVHLASVLNKQSLKKAAKGCDLVFHLASVVGMKLVTKNPQYSYDLSVEGTNNIFDAVGDIPVVLVSSSAVYGMGNNHKANEKFDISMSDALAYDGGVRGYAVGKYEMEQIGMERAYQGRPTLILRPFNFVGYGQVGDYGMVLPRFINSAMAGRPLTVYDDGTQSRCFSDISVGVDVILSLVEQKQAWDVGSNICNVGCNESTTILELANIVSSVVSKEVSIVNIPYEQLFNGKQDVTNRYMCGEHVSSLIGKVKWPLIENIVRDIYYKGKMHDRSYEINLNKRVEERLTIV